MSCFAVSPSILKPAAPRLQAPSESDPPASLFKDPCGQAGSTRIIQNNLPVSVSFTASPQQTPLASYSDIVTGPGLGRGHLWGHYSVHHKTLPMPAEVPSLTPRGVVPRLSALTSVRLGSSSTWCPVSCPCQPVIFPPWNLLPGTQPSAFLWGHSLPRATLSVPLRPLPPQGGLALTLMVLPPPQLDSSLTSGDGSFVLAPSSPLASLQGVCLAGLLHEPSPNHVPS